MCSPVSFIITKLIAVNEVLKKTHTLMNIIGFIIMDEIMVERR